MNALLLIPLLTLGLQAKAKIDINVNAKEGDVISGERTLRVTVSSKNQVSQVEFYVGGDLRDSDTSTPYEFRLDTIAEGDGPAKLVFKAWTTAGETAQKVVNVKIDNGMSKGADFHAQLGNELLTDSKWQDAFTEGRIALKIDSKSNAARMVLSRAKLGMAVYDDAQRYAEDAIAQDPKDRKALDLLAFIQMKRAFTTLARPDQDAAETRKAISDALIAGIDARRKSVDIALDAIGAPTAENAIAYADAALAARRYSLVPIALRSIFDKDDRRVDLGNRLAYAYVRDGNIREALAVLSRLKRTAQLDAYSNALLSVVYADLADADKSDDAMKQAILQGPTDPVVQIAQAYIALKYHRVTAGTGVSLGLNYDRAADTPERRQSRQVFLQIAKGLADGGNLSPEACYYIGALYYRLEQYDQGQSYFERAVLSEPINYDAYVEQGNRAVFVSTTAKFTGADLDRSYDGAKAMYHAALTARGESAEALTGLAVIAVLQNNASEALKWSSAATAANVNYAAGWVAQSLADGLMAKAKRKDADNARAASSSITASAGDRENNEKVARVAEQAATEYESSQRAALNTASKLDPQIQGLEIRDAKSLWRYYAVGGRRPLIPAPR